MLEILCMYVSTAKFCGASEGNRLNLWSDVSEKRPHKLARA